MSSQKGSKINQLLQGWPKGTVATLQWLEKQGVSRQLTAKYVKSGWLESLGTGAFIRAGDAVDWLGGVYGVQHQTDESVVHVGGETALLLKGLGHYLPLGGRSRSHLFGQPGKTLPAWFRNHSWNTNVVYTGARLFKTTMAGSLTDLSHGAFSVKAAAPERAILEAIYLAQTNTALEQIVDLMGGLTTLRPRTVQAVLESCVNKRVKRFFLWAAEHCGHSWVGSLETDRFDLGSSKRQVYKGGRLDEKYLITVPAGTEHDDV